MCVCVRAPRDVFHTFSNCVCACVCVCVCVTPKYFNQIISVCYKHHHSTALSALHQFLDNPLCMVFPPSQQDMKTMYTAPCTYHNLQPCMPMC